MSAWEEFEINVLKALKGIEETKLKFVRKGGSDSSVSDIEVYKDSKKITSLECKLSQSQAGQFVVLYNGTEFCFSNQNKCNETTETIKIIKKMNENIGLYIKVIEDDLPSVNLQIENSLSFEHVLNIYKQKGVKYFITSRELNSELIIVPLNKIVEIFQIKGVYRKKRSGSRDIPKSEKSLCYSEFEKKYKTEINFANLKKIVEMNNRYFGSNNEYYISGNSERGYKFKKLSNTNNPNVIFTLSLKENINCSMTIKELIDELEEL